MGSAVAVPMCLEWADGAEHTFTGTACERASGLADQARALVELLYRDTWHPLGSTVLEAGRCVGAQTVTLTRRSPGARFTSMDISADSVAAAESFDHVFVCFVLECLEAGGIGYREARDVMLRGGVRTSSAFGRTFSARR
jgi:hypothetical protein